MMQFVRIDGNHGGDDTRQLQCSIIRIHSAHSRQRTASVVDRGEDTMGFLVPAIHECKSRRSCRENTRLQVVKKNDSAVEIWNIRKEILIETIHFAKSSRQPNKKRPQHMLWSF